MAESSSSREQRRVSVIDTHTSGEPTRIVIAGGPDLGGGSLMDQRARFEERYDEFRSAVVNEPRGSDVMVGALLRPPVCPESVAGVIFFNNVGYLGMCGHGTIGVAVALAYLNRIRPGRHQLDTPVGTIQFELHDNARVTLVNIPAYRDRAGVTIDVPGYGAVTGDVAWGGNWFFLVPVDRLKLTLENVDRLSEFALQIRQTLKEQGITGAGGAEIDHIELIGPPRLSENQSRNFVLCPGNEYDRSPCGTGTSAHLACLFADGKLSAGAVYRQESIIGGVFEGRISRRGEDLIPEITGTAYVTSEVTLIIDPADPLRYGIRTTV